MEFLSEDPTFLAGGLGLLGMGFLIALKLTQQGKFLVWALASLGLAVLVVGVERVWVTDNERIEAAVYSLGQAVEASDVPGVLDRLAPDVMYVAGGNSMSSDETRNMLKAIVSNAKFDFLRINRLRASAGDQSRRGTAEFNVIAGGSYQTPINALNFGTHNSTWSLGFREQAPGVWKVNRITPVNVPGGQSVLPAGATSQAEASLSPAPAPPSSTVPGPNRLLRKALRLGPRGLPVDPITRAPNYP